MPIQARDTALTTTAAFKSWRGITASTDDTLIGTLVTNYSGVVSDWCGRKFAQTTYTLERYDGPGTPDLWLRNWPITTPVDASHGIWEDGTRKFAAGTKLTEDTTSTSGDYYIVPNEEGHGRVVRLNASWLRGSGVIQVSYVAGYSSIPAPLAEAVHILIAITYERTKNVNHAVTSTSIQAGGGAVTFSARTLPDDVRMILQPWKRMRIFG